MKSLKFRIWDGVDTMYYLNNGYYLSIFGEEGKIPWGLYDAKGGARIVTGDPKAIFNTPGILMQYTNLNDRDDVESYHGDIVKDKFGNIGVINYNAERGAWIFEDYFKRLLYEVPFKILGNVHENPTLIKK